MDETQRAQAAIASLVVAPAAAWFIVAKAVYGFTPQNVRQRITLLIVHTFNFWPLWVGLLVGFLVALIAVVAILHMNKRVFAGAYYDKFYRGTKLTTPALLARETTERGMSQIMIANVPVPTEAETTHFSIGGATGTGKSTIFSEMIFGCLRRGDRMVILDPDGAFLSKFYRPGDKILNPYDARTEGWSFFNEIRQNYDFERFAKSIIAPSKDTQTEEWNDYGRLLFREISRKLYNTSRRPAMRDVFDWTNLRDADALQAFVTSTAAQALFTGNDRATSSARFVLSNKLQPHLKMPERSFSLRDWLADSSLIIIPERDYANGLRRGEQYVVLDTGPGNRLTVCAMDGKTIQFSPASHGNLSVYSKEKTELTAGDQIKVTRNDTALDIANGDRVTVQSVTPTEIRLEGKVGRHVMLDAAQPVFVCLAYASTFTARRDDVRQGADQH